MPIVIKHGATLEPLFSAASGYLKGKNDYLERVRAQQREINLAEAKMRENRSSQFNQMMSQGLGMLHQDEMAEAGRNFQRERDEAGRDFTLERDKAGRDFTLERDQAGRDFTLERDQAGRDFTLERDQAGRDFTLERDSYLRQWEQSRVEEEYLRQHPEYYRKKKLSAGDFQDVYEASPPEMQQRYDAAVNGLSQFSNMMVMEPLGQQKYGGLAQQMAEEVDNLEASMRSMVRWPKEKPVQERITPLGPNGEYGTIMALKPGEKFIPPSDSGNRPHGFLGMSPSDFAQLSLDQRDQMMSVIDEYQEYQARQFNRFRELYPGFYPDENGNPTPERNQGNQESKLGSAENYRKSLFDYMSQQRKAANKGGPMDMGSDFNPNAVREEFNRMWEAAGFKVPGDTGNNVSQANDPAVSSRGNAPEDPIDMRGVPKNELSNPDLYEEGKYYRFDTRVFRLLDRKFVPVESFE